MRTRDTLIRDLIGLQNLTQLQRQQPRQRSTGLRGLSAVQVERDGQTGKTQIATGRGDELTAVDIGLGVRRNGTRLPSAVQDRGTTWIDYAG